VGDNHSCDECHITVPEPPWDHGPFIDSACTICHKVPLNVDTHVE
jgi:hypothetical protein